MVKRSLKPTCCQFLSLASTVEQVPLLILPFPSPPRKSWLEFAILNLFFCQNSIIFPSKFSNKRECVLVPLFTPLTCLNLVGGLIIIQILELAMLPCLACDVCILQSSLPYHLSLFMRASKMLCYFPLRPIQYHLSDT